MAKKPAKPTKTDDDAMSDEAMERLDDARSQKTDVEADIEECYYFAAPWRVRDASSQVTSNTRPQDQDELQTSLGFEVAEDFMTMLIDSFTPQSARWAERKGDPFLREADLLRINEEARKQDERIFEGIRASNFYAELAKQGVPDAAIGVIAMMVTDPGQGKPVQCVGVAIRELEINLGPDGRIDDRFVVRQVKYRDLKTVVPEVEKWPDEIAKKIEEEPGEEIEVVWGYWRKWDDTSDEVWQHVVLADDEAVHQATLRGEGCCPLVIGRFGAMPDFAWPQGPLLKALPDLRVIDETDAAFTENLDFTLRPPFAYPDDGVMNFEDGIEPGMGYPKRPGQERAIEKIWEPNPLDAQLFQHDQRMRRVRRLHYVDFPEQTGKTPPTATQWLDEMIEAQKKIGTPGYAYWREFPFEAFQRFRYLAEKRGAIPPIKTSGGVKVSLQAYNPAARAHENQEVLNAMRLAQFGASAFPQTWQVAVNELKTLQNVQKKMDDKLIEFRDQDDLAGAADLIGKLGGVFGPRLSGGLTGEQ